MTDIEDLRRRCAPIGARACAVCGGPTAEMSASGGLVVIGCTAPRNIDTDAFEAEHYRKSLQTVPASLPTGDPDVLALCDEVEALRAKVAAAPEVLREWPARAEDAPREWVYVFRGKSAYRGWFSEPARHDDESCGRPLFVNVDGHASFCAYFEPGEFFVRAPE